MFLFFFFLTLFPLFFTPACLFSFVFVSFLFSWYFFFILFFFSFFIFLYFTYFLFIASTYFYFFSIIF